MALEKETMASAIIINIAIVPPVQTSDAGQVAAYQQQIIQAFCQGLIDHIKASAVVTSMDGTPIGKII